MPETSTKKPYKKTLNLPRTPFDMRAKLATNEPKSMDRWESMGIYERVQEARAEAPLFAFHDGPPYANGSLHTGHLLNKVLKDVVVRSRVMTGRRCPYVPGWDCHGLPIEHKVMTDLVKSGESKALEALDEDAWRMAVRAKCQAHADEAIARQMGQMKRMLTLADYEHPYLTMQPGYEQKVLEVFADLVEQGLVYRALKPVHWSIANRTALAEAELEYTDREDPSIYVDFEAADRAAVAEAFGVEIDVTPSFMIWTTTPWTLPANLAIAVHPRFRYALVEVGGTVTIVASDRLKAVCDVAGLEDPNVLAECDGTDLVGLRYRHPFCDRDGGIVAAEYVTLEDGTGLVHTAPGHGADDYATGLREGLDVYCPVQADGTYDDTVPEWLRGVIVWKANDLVVAHLRESGHMVHDHVFTHSYPHDWRSRTPTIFRATEQWFVAVDEATKQHGRTLRELALGPATDEVTYVPQWGRNRFRGMLESRPDWCISRQRAWGLPIPAFRTAEGGVLLTPATVRAVSEAVGARGSDAWFTESPAELLATWDPARDPDAPKGASVDGLEKMHDIFDVWFESGSSWNAVMRARGFDVPVDLYLEGSDQHRGWFQLSLLPALGVTGHAPFRTLLTHGFVNDREGKKMSKSLGNALDVDQILEQYGADVLRWWVTSLAFENDMKADHELLELAGESYRKVRNTIRFVLGNLGDFTPTTDGAEGHCVAASDFPAESLDAWILEELGAMREDVLAAYERYDLRRVHQVLFAFCNETLSAFYLAAVKDRLYCDPVDAPRRRRCQTALYDVAETLITLIAPIMPHTADEAWRALKGDDAATVHVETIPEVPSVRVSEAWPKVLDLRDRGLKALEAAKSRGIENPLDAEVVVPDPDGVLAAFAEDLPDLMGVSRVRFDADATAVEITDLREAPRCERSWKRDGTVRERSDGGMLSDRDAAALGV